MEEKRNRLGTVLVTENDEDKERDIMTALVSTFKGDGAVTICKTEVETYVIQIKQRTEKHGSEMYLTKEGLSALFVSLSRFLEEEKEDMGQFIKLCLNDDSGYLYKRAGEEEP